MVYTRKRVDNIAPIILKYKSNINNNLLMIQNCKVLIELFPLYRRL